LFIFDTTDRTQVQVAREMDAEERFEPVGGSDGGMKNTYCTLYKYYKK
jgi:hypothetical protein